MEHGANPNLKTSAGAMPIHYAAESKNPGACRVLIEAGVDVNLPGKTWKESPQSYPPIWFSLQPKQTECFKLLIDAGAKYDLHKYYYGGQTILQFAASRGDFELCKRLVEEGADLKQRTENSNWSLMQLAARNGHVEICHWLYEKGFKQDELTEDKNTLLHLAAMSGNSELCHWLLDNGADLEARNNEWRTPLYSALQWRHLTVCQFLLEKGANLSAKDHEGKTPLEYLEAVSRHSMEHRELLPFLRSYYEKESKPSPLRDEPSKNEEVHGE